MWACAISRRVATANIWVRYGSMLTPQPLLVSGKVAARSRAIPPISSRASSRLAPGRSRAYPCVQRRARSVV